MNVLVMNCSPVHVGATATFAEMVRSRIASRHKVKCVCIGDDAFAFCKGCKSCYTTGRCVQQDAFDTLMHAIDAADSLVFVAPSYWADVPAQFKAFIDRCTPWCDTHEPHAQLRPGKTAHIILFRTGHGQQELDRLEETMRHFCGHMHIHVCSVMRMTGVSDEEGAWAHWREMDDFCENI